MKSLMTVGSMLSICSENRFRRPEKRVLGSTLWNVGVGPTPHFRGQRTLGPAPTPLSLACAAFFVILTACSTGFPPQTLNIDNWS